VKVGRLAKSGRVSTNVLLIPPEQSRPPAPETAKSWRRAVAVELPGGLNESPGHRAAVATRGKRVVLAKRDLDPVLTVRLVDPRLLALLRCARHPSSPPSAELMPEEGGHTE